MAGYEQSWLDYNGTISLKNNTKDQIHNVKFMLVYYDMKGNQLDYQEFFRPVDIAPNFTKKVDVPAYEHNRSYHYYKTPDNIGNPTFKVEYKLIDYNISTNKINKHAYADGESDHGRLFYIILFCTLLVGSGIYVGTYVLVAVMAKQRNRNPALWLVISFIATPILVIIILLVIGDADNNIYEQ